MLADGSIPSKVSVLSAVNGAQTTGAWEGGGGLFSHFLFEGLGRAKADQDRDASVTLEELASWLSPRVEREARRDGREQSPLLSPGAGLDPAKSTLAHGLAP